MPEYLYKSTIIPEVIKLIAQRYQLSDEEAMREFYCSDTLLALNDPKTGIYGQSALFIFSLFIQEKEPNFDGT